MRRSVLLCGVMSLLMSVTGTSFAFGVLAVSRGASPIAYAQNLAGCNNATLNGTYGSLAEGWDFTAPGPGGAAYATPQPNAAVALLTADGAGNITRSNTVNLAGTVNSGSNIGTYSVNADCTFSTTYPAEANGRPATRSTGVLVDGG